MAYTAWVTGGIADPTVEAIYRKDHPMTELCEPVAIGILAAGPEADEPCWYCQELPTWDLQNEEQADPDTSDSEGEDAVAENDENNCSSALGSNLGDPPGWTIQCPQNGTPTAVAPGAHHLIPGGASLAKATELHDFMRAGGPFNLACDIGYNVNAAANGVWLPANYGVRGGANGYTKNWSGFSASFKQTYAERAVQQAAWAQFHDAHPKYSGNVLKTLRALAEKLGEPESHCPVCNEELENGARPPFGLVGRLNRISGHHRILITTASAADARKYVQNGYYTSSRMKTMLNVTD